MMLESKDSAIKLFGMKIPFSSVLESAEEEEENISAKKNQNETQSEKDEKTLKKPTKILPCPRCKSMETKFCYYNNYNVNQPRHFCKACQRYWTSGGTMRSVPVGAGRRKNKINISPSQHYRHVTISETKGPVLSFSLKDAQNISNNNEDEITSRTRSNNNNETNGLDCFPGVPWPYTWNPGFYPVYPYWNAPVMSPVTSLGKHSREEEQGKQRNGTVIVPKTLRIDDPNEAAKSSIWTTLGIKKEVVMFKGFDSKKEHKEEIETSLVLSANPVALSRSLNFHENRM